MPNFFEVPIDDDNNQVVLFAVGQQAEGQAYAIEDDIIERWAESLQKALDMICYIGRCAADKLRATGEEVTEATVGVKFSGTGKFVVAEAAAEASLEVKFVFRKS